MQEDRSIYVQTYQHVITQWVHVNVCQMGCRERMDMGAIEKAYRRYIQLGTCQVWPPIVGHWEGDPLKAGDSRFVIDDGRHEYLALLALGRTEIFVAWLTGDPHEQHH